ncbi:MAG: T9SS type A sorting domain-containing protein [Ignavibacteriae bacterium]|nr:T9SS type A sorting domain-containing protein [Ignavibacteriota bacterium]
MKINKSIRAYFIVFTALICTPLLLKGQFTVELKFNASDTVGKPVVVRPLIVGIDDRATDSIDYNLGEVDLPQHPPSGFHAGLVISDGFGTGISYKDYRRIPPTKKFMIKYQFDVIPQELRGYDPFYISWEYPLAKYIDSARFADDLGGVIASFPFDEKRSGPSINTALKKFYISVWYNIESVVNNINNEIADIDNVYYERESDLINVRTIANSKITIYSPTGSTIWSGISNENNDNIDVQNLASGAYYLMVQKPTGMNANYKIMIVR